MVKSRVTAQAGKVMFLKIGKKRFNHEGGVSDSYCRSASLRFVSGHFATLHPNAPKSGAVGDPGYAARPAYGSEELDRFVSLPSPYPSSCCAGLGNGLGYYMPRLPALGRRE